MMIKAACGKFGQLCLMCLLWSFKIDWCSWMSFVLSVLQSACRNVPREGQPIVQTPSIIQRTLSIHS